ncbi:MAG: NUDIX domain-containing protein [Oscillospiraceae bacterium]
MRTARRLPCRSRRRSAPSAPRTTPCSACAAADRLAVERRPEHGLLAGLWELPNTPGLLDERQAGEYASGQGLGDVRLRSARDGRHIFTHIIWTMRCYTLECSAMPPRYHWATPDELREEISLPTAFRQFVDAE